MTINSDAWATLQRLLAALAAHYGADFRAAVAAQGLGREPVGVLLLAANVHPHPIAATLMLACLPYFAESAFSSRLARLAAGGWLEQRPDGYGLSSRGRAAAETLHSVVRERLADLTPMAPADLERMAQLVERLFLAGRADAAPSGTGCVTLSGNGGQFPAPSASALARTARAIEALANARCDGHRAAWQPLGVSGPVWEALTWLWQGRANSAASMAAWAEKQPFPRGWGEGDYAGFLDELAARGWAEAAAEEVWRLTAPGRAARERAEAQTDALFYAAWAAVTPVEVDELAGRAAVVAEALGARPV